MISFASEIGRTAVQILSSSLSRFWERWTRAAKWEKEYIPRGGSESGVSGPTILRRVAMSSSLAMQELNRAGEQSLVMTDAS